MTTLSVAEICAGYGGLYLAVRSLYPDAHLAWYAEIDRAACKVMERHHPDALNIGDITKDLGTLPSVDVIVGGTPCQDLSVAGKGAGISKGTRSVIVLDFLDIVAAAQPRMVLWENVGAARSRKGEQPGETVLGTVERRLREAGYAVRSMSLKASDVGAPHRRDRVFVLGTKDAPQPDMVPAGASNPHYLLPTPTVVDMGNNKTAEEWEAWTDKMRAKHKNGNGHGRSLTQEAVYNSGAYQDALAHWESASRRPQPLPTELLPTPTASCHTGPGRSGRQGGPNLQTAVHERGLAYAQDTKGRLSPRFVEWMMGLLPGYVTETPGLSRTDKLRLLGNGVVPQQGTHALATLLNERTPE